LDEFYSRYLLTVSFTTICWVLATFLTKPEPEECLDGFYAKVRPEGFWSPVRQRLVGQSGAQIPWQKFFAWISAVVVTFSALFGVGSWLLGRGDEAIVWGLIGLGALVLALFALRGTLKDI
jgi:hypothetical protein